MGWIHSSEEKTQLSERMRSIFAIVDSAIENFGLKSTSAQIARTLRFARQMAKGQPPLMLKENSVPAVIALHGYHVIKWGRLVHGGCDAI